VLEGETCSPLPPLLPRRGRRQYYGLGNRGSACRPEEYEAEHVKEEIHDILWSYYKVARKRFVDNVYQHAIDHCLLTGPMSPLAVFTQEWVILLDAEQLETIAGESPVTKERRAALTRKIQDLEVAIQILRH